MDKHLKPEQKKPQRTEPVPDTIDIEPPSCSLCGRMYHNFAFKGGYICEDCLQSIKRSDAPHQT